MNDKKQIEEMAREMCHLSAECKTCQICDEKYHGDGEPCYFQCMAREIINHGYRKQSEGIANNATTTGKWISVEERLPETNRDCLLLLDTEEIVIGYCRRDLHAFVEGGIVLVKDVTHWMPLPEAPKGGAG